MTHLQPLLQLLLLVEMLQLLLLLPAQVLVPAAVYGAHEPSWAFVYCICENLPWLRLPLIFCRHVKKSAHICTNIRRCRVCM